MTLIGDKGPFSVGIWEICAQVCYAVANCSGGRGRSCALSGKPLTENETEYDSARNGMQCQ